MELLLKELMLLTINNDIRLANFGKSRSTEDSSQIRTTVGFGLNEYLSPEIKSNESYDHKIDIW